MGYHHLDPADLDPEPDRPSTMRHVSEAADLDNVGLRLYEVAPGEDVPISGLHYHDEQAEAFYVADGTLAVDTPDREYVVEAGQFFAAEPVSPHRAHVGAADDAATVVGIGAPPASDGHAVER